MSFYIYETIAEKKGDVGMVETNEEILKRIIANAKGCNDDNGYFADVVQLDVSDYAHLIGQAEQAQKLEISIQKAIEMQEYHLVNSHNLQMDNQRFREALKKITYVYADTKELACDLRGMYVIARQALEGVSDDQAHKT